MKAFYQDKPLAVLADHDRGLQAYFQDALGDLVDRPGFERQPPFVGT